MIVVKTGVLARRAIESTEVSDFTVYRIPSVSRTPTHIEVPVFIWADASSLH